MIAVVFAILNADITTVNVALVTLGKDLHADLADLQWGLNSYMLAFAALIVADEESAKLAPDRWPDLSPSALAKNDPLVLV